ncbi:MAG: Rne/Rng family ribonuclease [Bacteroidia bacterium]|nr:Rne/Rng family ribonuclease [Bacteroidia bacterium]MCZ2276400.1 Rne/Rng family ribonuclease [Bacteroidia bacterium]
MNTELIINSTEGDVQIALLEDKRLVELNKERKDSNYSVGDIYLGKVRKLMPGLNAAFVEIGYEKDAFLHYLDLGPQFQSLNKYIKGVLNNRIQDGFLRNFTAEPDIEKTGKITQVMTAGQWLMVQVAKEPISTKGPRITTELSIPGRYLVLVPFSETISVSSKIKSIEERSRLKKLVYGIKPKHFGLIIRTVAEGKRTEDLEKDVQDLLGKWQACYSKLKTSKPPFKLLGEMDRTSTILRDMLNPQFNAINVNDQALANEIRHYIENISPEQKDIIKVYKGKEPIFEFYGVDKQIKSVFGKTVNLPNGAYLIIEHTEAMHVIDVNSGGRNKNSEDQENSALAVNVAAAKEIARQLRLRDMGGIIIVDFIDLHTPENKRELIACLKAEMKKDRARHTVLPPTKFGLVQITRERVRPEVKVETIEKCPSCDGTGKIKPAILIVDDIENNIRYFIQQQNEKKLSLKVHPFIEAYLKKGGFLRSVKWKWLRKFRHKIKIEAVSSYHFTEYHFFNKSGEEIKI